MRAGWKSAGRQSKAQLLSQAEIKIASILEKKRLRRNIYIHPAGLEGILMPALRQYWPLAATA